MLWLIFAVGAHALQCGDTLTTDATLTADLDCNSLPSNASAITIGADGVTLDGGGYQILRTGGTASPTVVSVDGRSDVTIRNLTISSGAGTGIRLNNTTNAVVRDVTVAGRAYGIRATGTNPGLTIEGTDVSDNSNTGMALQGTDHDLVLHDNTFDGSTRGLQLLDMTWPWTLDNSNSFEGAGHGDNNRSAIHIDGSTQITIDGADLSSTRQEGRGVWIQRSSSITVRNSDLSGRHSGLVTSRTVTDLHIENNDVSNARYVGMNLQEVAPPLTVSGNRFDGSAEGIALDRFQGPWTLDTDNSFVGVPASSTSGKVIYVLNSPDITLDGIDLSADSGQGVGVRAHKSHGLVLRDLDLSGRSTGLHAVESTELHVERVSVADSMEYGIHLKDSSLGAPLAEITFDGSKTGLFIDDAGASATFYDLSTSTFHGVTHTANDAMVQIDKSDDVMITGLRGAPIGRGVQINDSDGIFLDDVNTCGASRGVFLTQAEDTEIVNSSFGLGQTGIYLDTTTQDASISATFAGNVVDIHDPGGAAQILHQGPMPDADNDGLPDACGDLRILPDTQFAFDQEDVPWTSGGVGAPSVVYHPASELFVMAYETRGGDHPSCPNGVWHLGLATSADGLEWTDLGPLIQPDPNDSTYWSCAAAQPSLINRTDDDLLLVFKAEQRVDTCDGAAPPAWGCNTFTGLGRTIIRWEAAQDEYEATVPDASPILNVDEVFGYPKFLYSGGEYQFAIAKKPDVYLGAGPMSDLELDEHPTWIPGELPWAPDELFSPALACQSPGRLQAFVGGRALGEIVNGEEEVVHASVGRLSGPTHAFDTAPGPSMISTESPHDDPELRHWDVLQVGAHDHLLYFSDLGGPNGTSRIRLAESATLAGWDPSSVQSKVCK